jgi:hypothetical protein
VVVDLGGEGHELVVACRRGVGRGSG